MLGNKPQNDLLTLAAQTQMSLAQMQQQATAQAAMSNASSHIEVPQVNFYPSRHSNPSKARRQDIKQAYRLLKPLKRSIFSPRRWWGGKYRYNTNTMRCVVDGCDVEYLLRMAGNIYEQVIDEETGQSLFDIYMKNPVTGENEAFIARENVTSGRKLKGTYCPEHLHLYHLLTKWLKEDEKEEEETNGTLKAKLRKGVSTVVVPISSIKKKDNTPPILVKYEPFFQMLKKDNIPVTHFANSATGANDLVMIVFDMRQFQAGNNSRLLFDALAMHQSQQQQQQNQIMPLPTQSNEGSM
ncbi:MAG: hypothetical protein CL867_08985 [Cytophagaceae bacterium]|nr:hypothetical protein [Cytophagaceae bacterium]